MWQKTFIGTSLFALLVGVALAQEPRPKNPPPKDGGAPGAGFGARPGGPGGGPGGIEPRKGGPGERGKPPFGRGPKGEGQGGPPRGGEPRGPGFVPGGARIDMERLRQDDPEMYALLLSDQQLEEQTLDAADELRRAPSEQREKLRMQLSDLVNKHFDVRQQRRELQLKRMEAELGRLRGAIKERNDTRDKIIEERMTELTGSAKNLGF
jgi:hypothetical protein